MAYRVDRFNGTFLTSVEDGSIDNTTDLRFVGQNYAGYGEVQNENFLHLLENFSNTSPPPKAITGQLWYDSANKRIKFYDGTRFKSVANADIGTSFPSNSNTGDFWWDLSTKQLYVWSGTEYVLVGPEISPTFGFSGADPITVKGRPVDSPIGTEETEYTIVRNVVDGKTVFVVSSSEFLLSADTPINGFSIIKKGLTLIDTPENGITETNNFYWGTASNALNLGGIPPSNFIQYGDVSFNDRIKFSDFGYTLGDDDDMLVHVEDGNKLIISNQLGNDITFRISTPTPGDPIVRNTARVNTTGVVPGVTNTYTLGTSALRWKDTYAITSYATSFIGTLTGNSIGSHRGDLLADDSTVMINSSSKQIGYDGATIRGELTGNSVGNVQGTATNALNLREVAPSILVPGEEWSTYPNLTSIVQRDSTGHIYANNFIGVAVKADRLKIDDAAVDTDPQYRSAKTTRTANTIAARDTNGDILANFFRGTATAALYADLAEKYLADQEYEVGTVVSIGGEKEITACSPNSRAIGVVSARPAFIMNEGLEGGTPIALKGRVPVKVIGQIKKGDQLIAATNGHATTAGLQDGSRVFAVSMQDKDTIESGIVEAVIL